MGDTLDDNEWLVEKGDEDIKADWIADDNDEVDSVVEISDDDDNEAKEAKKIKRKQKFEVMKEKKRQKLEEDEPADMLEADPARNQLTPEEMLAVLDFHYPEDLKMKNDNKYTLDNFFYPAWEASAVTESTTKNFCPFTRALSTVLPNYKKILLETPEENQEKGSPTLLVLCSSAIRATEIIKSISSKLIKCKIAKLFAKHFKITDQIEFLSKEYFPIAIGTPNRVLKLMELGALQLSRTQVILIDYTVDVKNFNILTLPEVVSDFYQLLYNKMVYQERNHLKMALVKDASSKTYPNHPNEEKKKQINVPKEPKDITSTSTITTNKKPQNNHPNQQQGGEAGGQKKPWNKNQTPGQGKGKGKGNFPSKKKSFPAKKSS